MPGSIATTDSAYLRRAAARAPVSSAAEFKARRTYFPALAKFRSDLQDVAALSPSMNSRLLRLADLLAEHAPTQAEWDEAMGIKP